MKKQGGREGGSWAALHHSCPAPGSAAASAASFGSPAHSSQPREALYNEGRPEPRDTLGGVGESCLGRQVAAESRGCICVLGRQPGSEPGPHE